MTNKTNTKWLIWLTAISCLLALTVFSFLLFESSKTTKIAKAEGYSANQIIVAVNQERIKNNLKPLIVNDQLMVAAGNKAKDMSDKKYFSHVSPVDGRKWSNFIKEAGYVYVEAGENLANGYDSVESMVEAWMNSPTHRDNILNSGFVETGLAVEYGTLNDFPTIFVAQTFGRREIAAKEKPVEESNPKSDEIQVSDSKAKEEEVKPVQKVQAEPVVETKKYTSANTLAEIVSPFPALESK